MDLQTRKIEFVQKFLKLQSEEVIAMLENLLKQKTSGKNIMSTDELNKRIDKSEDDFKTGRYKTSSGLLAKYN